MKTATILHHARHHKKPVDVDEKVYIADLRKPWLLHTRKPKNRGNAGAGMKAKEFLKRVDALFPGGAR